MYKRYNTIVNSKPKKIKKLTQKQIFVMDKKKIKKIKKTKKKY